MKTNRVIKVNAEDAISDLLDCISGDLDYEEQAELYLKYMGYEETHSIDLKENREGETFFILTPNKEAK